MATIVPFRQVQGHEKWMIKCGTESVHTEGWYNIHEMCRI